MAAFYRLPRCLFYIVGGFHCGRFTIVFVRLPVRSEVKKIVHRMSEILFAAQIAFRRLHGYMPQQELNLLKLSAVRLFHPLPHAGSSRSFARNQFQVRKVRLMFVIWKTLPSVRLKRLARKRRNCCIWSEFRP